MSTRNQRRSIVALSIAAALGACSTPPRRAEAEDRPPSGAAAYAVTTEPGTPTSVGAGVTAVVRIEGRAGYHVNARYPVRLDVRAPQGVTLAKANLTASDATISEQAAVFHVAYTPNAAGRHDLEGDLRFSVCTAARCLIERTTVRWTAEVR